MTTITFYEVRSDERFRSFAVDGMDEWDDTWTLPEGQCVDGRTLASSWKPPAVVPLDAVLPEADFTNLVNFGDYLFAVRPEAFATEDLEIFLVGAGELLPLPHDSREFGLWNVTECVDALDRERSTYHRLDLGRIAPALADEQVYVDPPGQWLPGDSKLSSLASPRFWLHRLGWQLFTLPGGGAIYHWELSSSPPGERFRALFEQERLTGLRFEELYSDEWPF